MHGIFDTNENLNFNLSPAICTQALTRHTFIITEMILTYAKVRKQCKHAQLSFHTYTVISASTPFLYKELFLVFIVSNGFQSKHLVYYNT